MKKIYILLLSILLLFALSIGVVSLLDHDPTRSVTENRELAKKPELRMAALLDGSYISQLETYYSDTFPMRESLLKANRWMNQFYYYSGAQEENLLIIDYQSGAEQGGESLHRVEQELQASQQPSELQTPGDDDSSQQEKPVFPFLPVTGEEQTQHEQADPSQETEPQQLPEAEEEQPPELNNPDETEASYAGSVVVVGTRAMEIPTATNSIIEGYAGAVNNLSNALGEDVRTICLITPNGGEFYSPESLHTGPHSQKDMIDHCYEFLQDGVVSVDAYAKLRQHVDEYIYFRTDHHWTQLGAYYAYTAFCEAAGFEAVALDQFQTGRYDRFLGSMYTFTSGYPQSQTLKDNPDYLDYYLPIAQTSAQYYGNAKLENGVPVSVVHTSLGDSVSNKYLCFIGGDTPICIVETDTEGPVCMVLKESYGNAFVPFLTSHYSKIIVIDPREFNRDGKPSLDLAAFAQEQMIDDLIVINYPYMINSKSYTSWLNRLVGMD